MNTSILPPPSLLFSRSPLLGAEKEDCTHTKRPETLKLPRTALTLAAELVAAVVVAVGLDSDSWQRTDSSVVSPLLLLLLLLLLLGTTATTLLSPSPSTSHDC